MENLISAVIPAYGEIDIVKNSVVSLLSQWIPDDTFRLEVILVNDHPGMDYSYFVSEEFWRMFDHSKVSLDIFTNDENYGQGISRNIGIEAATSNWVILCDEDDIMAPDAIFRFWDALNKEHCAGSDGKPVAVVTGPLYSFDVNGSDIIEGTNIWPTNKLYNKEFLRMNGIAFPEGDNSHRSEDYPFINMLNFAIENNSMYKRVDFKREVQTMYFWIPNRKSRTRCHKFYGSRITHNTIKSTWMIYQYRMNYCTKYNIVREKEEDNKHYILNSLVSIYHGHFKYLYDLSMGWKDCEEFTDEVWKMYLEYIHKLKSELLVYWEEIVPSDLIWSLENSVRNLMERGDYIEPWLGSFESWITSGDITENMSYEEIKEYASTLKFDDSRHEINSIFVKSWKSRHGL